MKKSSFTHPHVKPIWLSFFHGAQNEMLSRKFTLLSSGKRPKNHHKDSQSGLCAICRYITAYSNMVPQGASLQVNSQNFQFLIFSKKNPKYIIKNVINIITKFIYYSGPNQRAATLIETNTKITMHDHFKLFFFLNANNLGLRSRDFSSPLCSMQINRLFPKHFGENLSEYLWISQ